MTSPSLPSKYTSKLHDASILILGGTSGIGYAVAEACLEFRCARLTISGSRQPKIDTTIARLRSTYPSSSSSSSTHLTGLACDLSDLDTVERNLTALLDFATSNGSHKLTHIVNTAGDSVDRPPLSEITPDTLHKSAIVRFYGSMMLAKLLASTPEKANPYIEISPRSSLTLTGGMVGSKPPPGWSATVPFIRVNCVAPGIIHTELVKNMASAGTAAGTDPSQAAEPSEKKLQDMLSLFKSKTLTDTVGQPEDVAEAYLWLMRDRFVTGQVVHSNGGYFLV